jgi:hypothetical protein
VLVSEVKRPAAAFKYLARTKPARAGTLRLLDEANYRLVRSNDDLLEAVCEVLQLVQADVGDDLPVLYGKPPRGTGAAREHLNEDALQAYLRRRLTDLLQTRVLGPKIVPLVLREDQVQRRRRLDLRVTAPCHLTQTQAQVIIEVKWSDNKEAQSSLTEQLARKYLLAEGLTHGVYLVGWCGKWTRTGRGTLTDQAALEDYLKGQGDDFCSAGPGAGLCIQPIMIDLRWRDDSD